MTDPRLMRDAPPLIPRNAHTFRAYPPLKAAGVPMALKLATTAQTPATPPVPIGPAPNAEVFLDLQVMLRIASHCTDNAPTIITGELVGLEPSPGKLEISNCFLTPIRRDNWNPRERPDIRALEEKHKREVDKYRTKIRELMHYVDADCQSLGWFQTLTHSAFADPAAVDTLYQRMIDVDRASILLGYDIERSTTGKFPFRAFQLSAQYIQLRLRQENGDLSAPGLLRNLATNAILHELRVYAKSTVAVDSLLLLLPATAEQRAEADLRAQLNVSHQLEQGLNFLSESLDEFCAESERLSKYQRDSSRYHSNLKRTIERKRTENEQRRLEGEEALHIEEENQLSNFERRVEVPNQLKTVMMLRQIQSVSEGMCQLARQNVAAGALANH